MNSLKKIHEQGLYVGSGVDDIVDNGLKTYLDEYGQYVVDYRKATKPALAKVALNSDDSKNDDELGQSLFAKTKNIKHSNKLGYYLDLYIGSARKGTFRKNGSSGGLVTWVTIKLLKTGKIDGFIHVKHSNKPGILFEYGISRSEKEIRSGAKSRYYPVELSSVLKEVKKTPGRYAVVGIPEIISELRLLAENDKQIKERIVYYFGLVAGHQKTTKYAEAIAWEYGIKPGDLEDIDFRHKRSIGKASEYDMKFTGLVDGERKTFIIRNNDSFVSSWAHGQFKARFSDFTDNSFNELADITFGDAWLKKYVEDPKGNNILIVRHPELAQMIKEGLKNNELQLDEVDSKLIALSQRGLVRHTKNDLAYRLYREIKKYGWAPKKRVKPDNSLPVSRQKVQDARQEIAEKSHRWYKEAVEKGDFEYFKNKMEPYIRHYAKEYGQQVAKKPRKTKADGAILTLTGYFNYGNVVQRYALQRFLKQHGHNYVSLLNTHNPDKSGHYPISNVIKFTKPLRFIKRFMKYEKPYWYTPSIATLYPTERRNANLIEFVNRNIWTKVFNPEETYRNYIVGSDQVWRKWRKGREILGYYFFAFLRGRKANRVSYAASFGKDNIEEVMTSEDIEYLRPYVTSFDNISVREKSGLSILENVWGKNGTLVVDPTLLITKVDYSDLIEKTEIRFEKIQPIFTYVIGETAEILQFIRRVQDERQQAVTAIRAHAGSEDDILPPVELWLKGFRDAELVITNSFHGMMLSVINNRDFIIIGREAGGLSRITDFLTEYGLENRFVDEADLGAFDVNKLSPIHWGSVNAKLDARRHESGDWLLGALR